MAKIYDTLIWEYIKKPGSRNLGLDDLAIRNFDLEKIKYKDLTNNAKEPFSSVDLDMAAKYSIEDVFVTRKLYDIQSNDLSESDKKVMEDMDFPLIDVLISMEEEGLVLDVDKLDEIWEELKSEIAKLQKEIYEDAWEEFNISSPKQVSEILFVKIGLPPLKKTKTGYSVNAEVLEELSHSYPFVEKIVTFRHYSKLLSTYVVWLKDHINLETGRLHPQYSQVTAATGRLSSNNPNIQNIPSTSGIAGEIRKAFVPFSEDDTIIAFDYSQVELRLLAIMSWDENLLDAYKNDEDIHERTAKFMFNKDDISSDERKKAKVINFSVVYWVWAFSLAKRLNIPNKEAQNYIDAFFSNYSGVREYFDKTIENCEENGYVETMFWRKRYIDGINDRNKMMKKSAEREAINTPIQGTASDIIKIAMNRVFAFLKERDLKTKMIIQVHDELVFNVPADEKELIKTEIPRIMESVIDAEITLKTDTAEGKNWREAK